MPTIKTSPIRLWFSFNHQRGTIQRHYTPGVLTKAVVHDVAMNMSDEYFKVIKTQMVAKLRRDIRQELGHVAQMYRKMIVGISGRNGGPSGTLTTLAQPVASYRFSLHWPARSQRYLTRKLKRPGHTKWFLGNDRVLYSTMGKATTWLGAFGPISVEITRKSMDETATTRGAFPVRFKTGLSGNTERLQIATVRVKAFSKITPAMLPAMERGDFSNMAADGGDTGLTGLFPSPIAYRLAGDKRYVPYRHTLEPFLAFFLQRAIPSALAQRMQLGLEA